MKLVLLRHGESQWNQENRFTGWVDADLSAKGFAEAVAAGKLLKSEGLKFDLCFTSLLTRAIRTAWIALGEAEQLWIPMEKSWRLNERHYGSLQGLNKSETAARYGEEKVFTWRRSYDVPPPPLAVDDPSHPRFDRRYQELPIKPAGESLKDTLERFLPFYFEKIEPSLKKSQNLLIVAHGNSLRALIKHLEQISDSQIAELNIPTGIPLMYELDANLKPKNKAYLGDAAAAEKAAKAVAQQAKK